MTHLSLNTAVGGRFYGINYSNSLIDNRNPSRVYFITENADFLRKLKNFDGNNNSDLNNQAKQIIGFIYGILFFHANLIPFDVEITLGYYNDEFKVNVLDFGLTIDLSDIENASKHFHTIDVLNILASNISEVEKSVLLKNDESCINGWE